jgi:hypothetical protein
MIRKKKWERGKNMAHILCRAIYGIDMKESS